MPRLARLLVVSAGLLLPSGLAAAQIQTIPGSTITSPTISSSQQEQLAAYVQAHVDGLFGGDASAIRRSRAALVEPLENRQASVAFRQAYGRALQETLDRLLESEDPTERIVGLALLGELATEDAVRRLEEELASEDDATRLFAVTRGERVFEILALVGTGLTPERAVGLAQRIGAGIPEESDTLLADTRVRALAKAAQVPDSRIPGLRDAALRAIGEHFGVRVRALDAAALDAAALRAVVRAAEIARQNLLQAGGSMPGREATRELLAFSGDILSLMESALRQNALGQGEVATLAATATAEAENIYLLTRAELSNGGQASPVGFRAMLESGNQREFSLRYARLFGGAGELTQRPFGLDASRFLRAGDAGSQR